jgi:DNA-binding MarR family transcriptional regulator
MDPLQDLVASLPSDHPVVAMHNGHARGKTGDDVLRRMRHSKSLTQAELADMLYVTHQFSLGDVRLLHILGNFPDGTARMRELAEALPATGSRLTRQTRRLEAQGMLRRATSPGDRRGVIAIITDEGRAVAEETTASYAQVVRKNFIDRLTRSQIAAMENGCRRITSALK